MKDTRTLEQLKIHYKIEKELADKLREATAEERLKLYTPLYNEFFKRVPHTSQLSRKKTPLHIKKLNDEKMKLIGRYLNKNVSFLEIGAGDCSLSLEIAPQVKFVYSVEVSNEIASGFEPPDNFKLLITNGLEIPVPENSIDLAYSNQLMEHLHPDDAIIQLKKIYDALNSGGKYLCITPNRFYGPHDISKHFDEEATGFHLKEYTISELVDLFISVGFSKFELYAGGRGVYQKIPLKAVLWTEKFLHSFKGKTAKTISSFLPIKAILGINIIGYK
jgi:SAM-dependent methyltransferase